MTHSSLRGGSANNFPSNNSAACFLQAFLCADRWATWQSTPQYFTNLQALHDFKLTSALPQAAQLSIPTMIFETNSFALLFVNVRLSFVGYHNRVRLPLIFYVTIWRSNIYFTITKVRYVPPHIFYIAHCVRLMNHAIMPEMTTMIQWCQLTWRLWRNAQQHGTSLNIQRDCWN